MNEETKIIKCIESGCSTFEFTPGEQEFYTDKGFPPPKRCQTHRLAKKQRIEKEKSPFHPKNWRENRKDRNTPSGDKEMFN